MILKESIMQYNWRKVLSASQEDIDTIAIYLESKLREAGKPLDVFKRSERDDIEGKEVSYSYTARDASQEYYSIEMLNVSNEIRLFFDIKKIIKGESLADPRAAYETTGAHFYKTKRRKLDRFCKDIDTAKKVIDRFFSKAL